MCGTAAWEWDAEQGGSRFAYEPIEKYCHGCYIKTVMSEESGRNPGITIELAPTGTIESARRHVKARDAYLRRNAKAERDRAPKQPQGPGAPPTPVVSA